MPLNRNKSAHLPIHIPDAKFNSRKMSQTHKQRNKFSRRLNFD